MKKTLCLSCLFVVAAVLFIMGLSFYLKLPYEIWDRLLQVSGGETRYVVLESGFTARQCAQAFFDQGALEGAPAELARWMTRFGIDRKIRPGQYEVRKADPWDLARQLRTVRPVVESLTIIPGMDVFSLRSLFSEANNPSSPESGDLLKSEILENLNYPEPMRDRLPSTEEGRIAFLRPETYFVVRKTPEELIRLASRAWWGEFGEMISGDLTSTDLQKAGKVASMVQREALWDEERPVIAGVIENRLGKEMLLQIDATVVYAWKMRGRNLTRVMHSDLTLDSPYNTYVKPGLPPNPICIPSAESWRASFAPEENRYYYYVARKDGRHYFAENYDDHLRNIKKARTEQTGK